MIKLLQISLHCSLQKSSLFVIRKQRICFQHKDQLPSMGIYEVWSRGFTGSGVTVAFLDDGVQTKHSDLRDNLVMYY